MLAFWSTAVNSSGNYWFSNEPPLQKMSERDEMTSDLAIEASLKSFTRDDNRKSKDSKKYVAQIRNLHERGRNGLSWC